MKAIVIVVLIHILKAIVSALNGSVSRSDNHYEWWNDCCATTEPGSWLIWIKICHQEVWFWLMIASCPHHLKLAPAGQWFLIQAAPTPPAVILGFPATTLTLHRWMTLDPSSYVGDCVQIRCRHCGKNDTSDSFTSKNKKGPEENVKLLFYLLWKIFLVLLMFKQIYLMWPLKGQSQCYPIWGRFNSITDSRASPVKI